MVDSLEKVSGALYSQEFPAGKFPPDPFEDRPEHGWFADKTFGLKRWTVFVALSEGKTGTWCIETYGVNRKSINAWVAMWRRWWPSVLPLYGNKPVTTAVTYDRFAVVDELERTAARLGAFESVPGRSLAAAAVESASVFVEWAQGLSPEDIRGFSPQQAAAVGRVSAKLMESAFELESRLGSDGKPERRSSVTNNLLISVESDGSTAEKLGAVLDAYKQAADD